MGVIIKSVGMCKGKKIVPSSIYTEHFKKLGRKDPGFAEDVLGIKTRCVRDETQTMISLGIEAANDAIELASIKNKDIDCVVLASVLPEYTLPPTSALIAEGIGCKEDISCYDISSACAGGLLTLKQAYGLFSIDAKLNRVLVVACDDNNLLGDKGDPYGYGMYSDIAVAIILERTEEVDSGFIDCVHHVYRDEISKSFYPRHGRTADKDATQEERAFDWNRPTTPITPIPYIRQVLEANNLNSKDIKAFCLSQFAVHFTRLVNEEFKLEKNVVKYFGENYGYAGCASPLVALYEQVREKSIKTGDLIVFWTNGAGFQDIVLLIRY